MPAEFSTQFCILLHNNKEKEKEKVPDCSHSNKEKEKVPDCSQVGCERKVNPESERVLHVITLLPLSLYRGSAQDTVSAVPCRTGRSGDTVLQLVGSSRHTEYYGVSVQGIGAPVCSLSFHFRIQLIKICLLSSALNKTSTSSYN